MDRFYINDIGMINSLGAEPQIIYEKITSADQSSLQSSEAYHQGSPSYIGEITSPLKEIPENLKIHQSRNNKILIAAAEQIRQTVESFKAKYGAHRIGVVLGTSTSGIRSSEEAIKYHGQYGKAPDDFHCKQAEIGNCSELLSQYFGLTGTYFTVSTACSSSAHALASARRLIKLDLVDMVIAGGVDSLCNITLQGFSSLESISKGLSTPFASNRDGINIGEGVSLMVISKTVAEIELLGIGSSSDAHHISAPEPSGRGAIAAMNEALGDAGLLSEHIDYLNLHGTATPKNDAMEYLAVKSVFATPPPCSSSKSLTGHTLGAAGATEIGFCYLLLSSLNTEQKLLPQSWTTQVDPELADLPFVSHENNSAYKIDICMSNSFAFGGNNISVIIGKAV